jgi:hypothetical protein
MLLAGFLVWATLVIILGFLMWTKFFRLLLRGRRGAQTFYVLRCYSDTNFVLYFSGFKLRRIGLLGDCCIVFQRTETARLSELHDQDQAVSECARLQMTMLFKSHYKYSKALGYKYWKHYYFSEDNCGPKTLKIWLWKSNLLLSGIYSIFGRHIERRNSHSV